MEPVTGSCLCGGVRFQLNLPSKWVAHCHCTFCRRAHGAAFVTWVGVASERFQILAGSEMLGSYHSTPEATRSFCKTCGSPLFFESTRWPGEVHIAVAHVQGTLDRAPQSHVFFDSKVSWISINDGLPQKSPSKT